MTRLAGLKVFGEGEWKVKKHGAEKRRTWRKLHLAIDVDTHEAISAEVSLVNVGEIIANVKAINKVIGLGMPVRS